MQFRPMMERRSAVSSIVQPSSMMLSWITALRMRQFAPMEACGPMTSLAHLRAGVDEDRRQEGHAGPAFGGFRVIGAAVEQDAVGIQRGIDGAGVQPGADPLGTHFGPVLDQDGDGIGQKDTRL